VLVTEDLSADPLLPDPFDAIDPVPVATRRPLPPDPFAGGEIAIGEDDTQDLDGPDGWGGKG
jgi:hypothetical protein